MPYAYAQALAAIAKDGGSAVNNAVLNRLEEYGYIEKTGAAYRPTFLVMFKNKSLLRKVLLGYNFGSFYKSTLI